MNKIIFAAVAFVALSLWSFKMLPTHPKAGIQTASPKKAPVPVILDTDIGPDFDDAGALAILHALADKKEATILAVVSCNRYPYTVPMIDVINTYYKRGNIPVGTVKTGGVNLSDENRWNEKISAKYPHRLKTNADAPDAITVYRSVLAKQPDASVVLVTVGFLTNLKNLLQSKPDAHSKLTGRELVARKVKKLVVMGGRFPQGKEFNVEKDTQASQYTFAHWPGPVLFSGVEIGEKIYTGNRLVKQGSADNPVRESYAYCLKTYQGSTHAKGRNSWDQTAVLAAIRGSAPYWNEVTGQIKVNSDGSNTWDKNGPKKQSYLVSKYTPAQMAVILENLMMHEPK